MEVIENQFLWVEKYRPQTIADCILPAETKEIFQEYVRQKNIPNLLLSGTAGIGKTTIAKALCKELGCDYMIMNASNENGIGVVRTKITSYASAVSFSGGRKYIIMDEADNLTADAMAAFRFHMEEFSANCGFIFTANFPNRMIEAIRSRCSAIDFKIQNGNKAKMAVAFLKRIDEILTLEGVTYKRDVVIELIQKHFPDFRRTLNELQKYAASGTIDAGALAQLNDASIKDLIANVKAKDFTKTRKWVGSNADSDVGTIYRKLYDELYDFMDSSSIPQAVVIIAEYSYRNGFVSDPEINLMACLTNLMTDCAFK